MNILHNKIKLKYWRSLEDCLDCWFCWKNINDNNELWQIIMYNKNRETVNHMKITETRRVNIDTSRLFDVSYLSDFRFYAPETNIYEHKILWIDDIMWFTCYDYKDKLQLYISINSKTLECNVYTEVDPILNMILGE
ncbi:hypothetical protein N4T77_00080 [Clostridium sp. CX1]|uniref:hypothetical protein n=1 Tax=Clostridium sp. CX1 TaxID=2978346 RepID=UPI0021C1358A|nr:hypothetical protein [Clostridium sp. CX1]MCT8974985.1 hypothetical protein [Clostridium sp. CX1]